MKKNLAILLAVASALVIVTLVGVAYAQNVNGPITQRNNEAPICVNDETGYCADNTNCNSNQYGQGQAQQNCYGFGYQTSNQNRGDCDYGYNNGGFGCESGFQRGCR